MRIGQLYQRTQTGSWYCKVDGKQKKMGPTETLAIKARNKLVAQNGPTKPVNGQRKPTVQDMLTHYLAWHKKNRAETSHIQRQGPFETLCKLYGDREAGSLAPADLFRWIELEYPNTGNTRQNDLISYVQTAYNWIERNHGIPSKIRKVDKPTPDQREFYIEFRDWDRLLSCCPPHVHDLVSFLLYTGARPQEARILKPKHWNSAQSQFVLPASQAKGKKKPRVIFVPTSLHARVEELVKIATATRGYVFTNSRGGAWNKTSFNSAARRIKVKMNMPEFCMYVCRHSFAVERIVRGKLDLAIVAKLMGHSSTDMVYQKYGHIGKQNDVLLAAVNTNQPVVGQTVSN